MLRCSTRGPVEQGKGTDRHQTDRTSRASVPVVGTRDVPIGERDDLASRRMNDVERFLLMQGVPVHQWLVPHTLGWRSSADIEWCVLFGQLAATDLLLREVTPISLVGMSCSRNTAPMAAVVVPLPNGSHTASGASSVALIIACAMLASPSSERPNEAGPAIGPVPLRRVSGPQANRLCPKGSRRVVWVLTHHGRAAGTGQPD